MSSGGGPRATGSNIKDEGKFRQRVDEHYKLIADARPLLGSAWKLQTASTVAFAVLAAAGQAELLQSAKAAQQASLDADLAFPLILLWAADLACAAVLLWAAFLGRGILATIPSQPVLQTAKYKQACLALVLALGLTAAGPSMIDAGALSTQPITVVCQVGSAVLGIFGGALGTRASSKLMQAFEQQAAKKRGR